jgi:hypothetical protein
MQQSGQQSMPHVRSVSIGSYLFGPVFLLAIALQFALISATRAQSEWPVQVHSTPFHFHSDKPLDDIDAIIAEIKSLPNQLASTIHVKPNAELIHVVVMNSEEKFQRYIRHYFPTAPIRRALFIKDRGPGIVFTHRHAEMLIDLRHECTHALLQDQLPNLPLWMDEGIAEYFEVSNSQNYCNRTHLESIRWQTRLGYVPSITDLGRLDDVGHMAADDYRDSWAWIHFLMHHSEASKSALIEYLHDLQRGATAGVFAHRLQRAVPNWRDAFINHFQQFPSDATAEIKLVSQASNPE